MLAFFRNNPHVAIFLYSQNRNIALITENCLTASYKVMPVQHDVCLPYV